jgi:hypothetical protein
MKSRDTLVVCVLAFCVVGSAAFAQECPRLINRWAAEVDQIEFADGFLFLTFDGYDSNSLAVFEPNGADPPRFVAQVPFPSGFDPGNVPFIVSSGGVALVSDYRELAVFDVHDPGAPKQAAVLDLPVVDAVISGNLGLLAAGTAGFIVVDLSVATRPTRVASVGSSGAVIAAAATREIAYLFDRSIGLLVFDVSNPSIPVEVGLVPLDAGYDVDMIAEGDHLFLASEERAVVFDIRDPSRPEVLAVLEDALVMATDGRHLFLSGRHPSQLQSFELTPGFPPEPLGALELSDRLEVLEVVGDHIIAGDDSNRLTTIDISQPADPTLTMVQPALSGVMIAVDESRNRAYLAEYGSPVRSEFLTVDVSDPLRPRTIGSINSIHNQCVDVTVFGDLAVAAERNRIHTIDVSDPATPEIHGSLGGFRGIRRIGITETNIVLATSDGLVIVDVGDPRAPTEVGRYTGAIPVGVAMSGTVAFLACGIDGLRAVDVSDPATPIEIASVPGEVSSVARGNGVLFVGQDTSVRILDVSNPTQPIELSRFDVAGSITGMDADGRWLTVDAQHLTIVDVLEPSAPRAVGWTSNDQLDDSPIGVSGGTAFVGGPGLTVFDLSGCEGPTGPWAHFRWQPRNITDPETPVRFSDQSEGGPTSWQWDFGDGSDSQAQHPSHTFAEPGSYQVALTITSPHGTDTSTRTVLVHGDPDNPTPPITAPRPWQTIVPAAANVRGLEGTSWFTDLVVYNPQPFAVEADLFFLMRGADSREAPGHPVLVPAEASLHLADVVGDLLRHEHHGDGAGGILVASEEQLIVSSRSFNQAGSWRNKKTFGQRIAATPHDRALACGDKGYLVQLMQSESTRTNLGFANPSPSPVDIEVEVRSSTGDTIGRQWYTVEPYSTLQRNAFMRPMSDAPIDDAHAIVRCLTDGAGIVPYASVVDTVTGDPTTIDVTRPSPDPVYLLGVAHLDGANATTWRSDVVVVNPTDLRSRVRLELVLEDKIAVDPVEITIEAGGGVRMVDVVGSIFGRSGKGFIRAIPVEGEIIAHGRTYTVGSAENGTYGLSLPPVFEADAVSASNPGLLLQLATSPESTSGFRTNVGLLALSDAAAIVEFFRADGVSLGTVSLDLEIREFRQLNDALALLTPFGHSSIFAHVRTGAPEERVLAYGSVVDNRSGDPMFIPAVPLE